MTAIFCIVDGMTDEYYDQKEFPYLSALTKREAWGRLQTTPPGFSPGTMPCIFTLLGLAPEEIPRNSRGWLEASGLDVTVPEGALAVRTTWSQVDNAGVLSRVSDAPRDVFPVDGVCYQPLGGYKGLLMIEGWGSRSDQVTTHAPHDHWGEPLAGLEPTGCPPLRDFFEANRRPNLAVMPWGHAGAQRLPHLPRLDGAAAVAATPLVRGMLRELGVALWKTPGATGETNTDLKAKLDEARRLATEHPLVVLHLGGADEAAHHLDPVEKRDFLRRVDEIVVKGLGECGCRVLICPDHGTSAVTGKHLGGAQPFVLAGTGERGDMGTFFGGQALELLCSAGRA